VEFSVIDTGGYVEDSDDIFEGEINKQVRLAIDESDIILFMVDVTAGVHELDKAVASMLRKAKREIFLVVNKVDNNQRILDAAEFYSLGLGDYYMVSSISGSGTGDLLDRVVAALPAKNREEAADLPRIAIVGRPNVGKSSLLNTLLGEERNIVTPVAGTTRDPIYSRFNKFGYEFLFVDTAGLRKKGKVNEDVEFYSVMRAVRTIENSDICLMMIDGTRTLESQDLNIISLILKNNKGMILLVNKWDLVEKDNSTAKSFEKEIRNKTAPFVDYPILFISAITRQRTHRILSLIASVNTNKTRRIPTAELNEYILDVINRNPPPAIKGKYVKVKYATQLPTHAPSFAFFCNLPQYIKEPYKRFVENRLREKFEFTGVPLRIFFRKK